MNTVQIRGLEVWLDGERIATITPGLSETTMDRVRAAFEGVKISACSGRQGHVEFWPTPTSKT